MGSALLNTMDPAAAETSGHSTAAAIRAHTAARFETADAAPPLADGHSASAAAIRELAAQRLAAHRSRRGGTQTQPAHPTAEPARSGKTRSSRIAAAVAERYANTQSYRAFLAAEAERATLQARAAAEVAALNAQAVAAAQQRLLDALDQAEVNQAVREDATHNECPQEIQKTTQAGFDAEAGFNNALAAELPHDTFEENAATALDLFPGLDLPTHRKPHHARPHAEHRHSNPTSNAEPQTSSPVLTVRLYEDAAQVSLPTSRPAPAAARANRYEERNEAEARALDEEIAFRQAPVFEEPAGPPVPLPANLIQFPRQLVASRKARPRYAEGPLRDDADAAPGDGQLRIFEVDPAQISTTPEADPDSDSAVAATPQWTSIWLDAPPQPAPMEDAARSARAFDSYDPALRALPDDLAEPNGHAVELADAATMRRRALAAAINGAIVLAGLLAFAATFLLVAAPSAPGNTALSLHMILGQMADFARSQSGLSRNLIAGAAAGTVAFLALIYDALFFRFAAATPGMRCARIALCTFDDTNPSRRSIRHRAAAMLLSVCPLGLGYLWAAIDEDCLTWHDRITRTYLRTY